MSQRKKKFAEIVDALEDENFVTQEKISQVIEKESETIGQS